MKIYTVDICSFRNSNGCLDQNPIDSFIRQGDMMHERKRGDMVQKVITVKFDGHLHRVDVGTFTRILLDYGRLVRAVEKELGLPNPIKVSISATEEGSLDALLALFPQIVDSLALIDDPLDILQKIAGIVAGLYALRQWISGRKMVTVDEAANTNGSEIKLVSSDGDCYYVEGNVYNIYTNNQDAEKALTSTFGQLDIDEEISALEILDNGASMFRAEREEFASMALPAIIEDETTRRTNAHMILTIVKPVLENTTKRRWEFNHVGRKLSATIADEQFIEDLTNGRLRFGVGDALDAIVEIIQKQVEGHPELYSDERHTIIEVRRVIPSTATEQLF